MKVGEIWDLIVDIDEYPPKVRITNIGWNTRGDGESREWVDFESVDAESRITGMERSAFIKFYAKVHRCNWCGDKGTERLDGGGFIPCTQCGGGF